MEDDSGVSGWIPLFDDGDLLCNLEDFNGDPRCLAGDLVCVGVFLLGVDGFLFGVETFLLGVVVFLLGVDAFVGVATFAGLPRLGDAVLSGDETLSELGVLCFCSVRLGVDEALLGDFPGVVESNLGFFDFGSC